ncbi:MAG: hypothetical protein RMN51_05055 [Verrucomicrobiota bacterium]|nr:hypothetical protein [Limisphaera sp.]MDW8381459.1 hypothetical protein [Verrucomicrobiota bacterium]
MLAPMCAWGLWHAWIGQSGARCSVLPQPQDRSRRFVVAVLSSVIPWDTLAIWLFWLGLALTSAVRQWQNDDGVRAVLGLLFFLW